VNTDLMFSSKSDEWETPQDLFNSLNDEFHFTLDPCSTHENHKCDKYYTQEDDGLSKDWAGETVFCNPPYGRSIGKWVEKCYKESLKGSTVVMLIPSRTDTKWFHKYIYNKAEIRFLKGRLKFINRALPSWNEQGNYKLSPAPFPSMIVIFKPNIQ
jgi:site-specific DNA-methyltransferase (adenine-specific)